MKICFEKVGKRFSTRGGQVQALREFDLTIEAGEFFVLLGPSGCGKSTLLNLAAGLEYPTRGVIRFGDRIVADASRGIWTPARERDVAMVFQSYALYPHMDVFGNIAFPLRIAGRKKDAVRRAVEKTAAMLGLEALLARKPRELSGGQRQRVAMARALVREPALFLLDEPLSNLDAQLRTQTRAELKRLQRQIGVTTLYVTHDQTEAMTLGDRIGLLQQGQLVQVDTPARMYAQPRTAFAARFMGSPPMNLLPVAIRQKDARIELCFADATIVLPQEKQALRALVPGDRALLGVRPEHVRIQSSDEKSGLRGRIHGVELLGREVLYHVQIGGERLLVLAERQTYPVDQQVGIEIPTDRIHLFPPP